MPKAAVCACSVCPYIYKVYAGLAALIIILRVLPGCRFEPAAGQYHFSSIEYAVLAGRRVVCCWLFSGIRLLLNKRKTRGL